VKMTRSRRRLRKGRVALAIFAVLALLVGIPVGWSALNRRHHSNSSRASTKRVILNNSRPSGAREPRRVFKYSVVPGGVNSPEQLTEAADRDATVRDHYQGIYLSQVTKTQLDQDMSAYVSYRLKNKIYWTQKKIRLHKGELVLTDGEHMVRGRCGNRISVLPVGSGAGPEPAEPQFDVEEPTEVKLVVAAAPVPAKPTASDSRPPVSAFVPPVAGVKAVPTPEKVASRRLFPILAPIAILAGNSLAAAHSTGSSGISPVNPPASHGSSPVVVPAADPPSPPRIRVPILRPPPSSGPPITVAPEPSAYFGLLSIGLGWLVVRSRRNRAQR
jgi:hypothetical protein